MALTRCYRCGKLASTNRSCKVCGSERHIEPELDSLPRIPLADRQAYAATAPWVTRLQRPTTCDARAGHRSGHRCKKKAEWSYKTRATVGWGKSRRFHFCWNHLWSAGLRRDPAEESRWDNWTNRNPPPWWTEERRRAIEHLNEQAREREVLESRGVPAVPGGGASDD